MNAASMSPARKLTSTAVFLLTVGNFLFMMGIMFAVEAYLKIQNTAYVGILGRNAVFSNFPKLGPTEHFIGISCVMLALSAIIHEANLLISTYLNSSKVKHVE